MLFKVLRERKVKNVNFCEQSFKFQPGVLVLFNLKSALIIIVFD